MNIRVSHQSGRLTANIFGELDHHTAPQIRDTLDDAIKKFSDADLVLDLKNLSFMDSSGLGVLLGRYKLLKSHGRGMYVKNVGSQVEKVFCVSGMYQIVRKIK